MKIGKYRIQCERVDDYGRPRGLGFSTRGGCLGSTYGEPGQNMFRDFTVMMWLVYTISFSWKSYR